MGSRGRFLCVHFRPQKETLVETSMWQSGWRYGGVGGLRFRAVRLGKTLWAMSKKWNLWRSLE
jgi:hypothetical protein